MQLDRIDVTAATCWSIDLRSMTSAGDYPDETRMVEPGVFKLSVCPGVEGDIPIGEVRIIQNGIEISVVGHLTGRVGVVEVTPDHLAAAKSDDNYRQVLLGWVQGNA